MAGRWNAHRIALIYIIFSALWILASDRIVTGLFPDFGSLARAQTLKGLCFVTASALLVFFLTRNAEKKLLSNELRLREIIEAVPEALFLLDLDGRILDANAAASTLYGYSPEALLQLTIAHVAADGSRDDVSALLREATKQGLHMERRHRRRDGREILVEINVRPVVVGGQPRLLNSVRDITARKEMERSYQLLFQSMHGAFALHEIICDASGKPVDYRFLAVNGAFEKMTGLTADAIIGHTVREILPDTEVSWIEQYGRVALTGEPTHFVEYHRGLGRSFEITAYRPAPGKFACLASDVTERERAEQAHRIHEERLQLALAGAELGMWDWRIDTDEAVFDERWAAMLGYELAEVEPSSRFWRQLIHPEDAARVDRVLGDHVNGRTPFYAAEHRLRHKSGRWIWVLDRGKVIERDADGTARRMCGTHLDITDRKNAETEREQLSEQLRQAQKMEAVGQLAGGVAHDFNNLLQVINGYAELALVDLEPNSPVRTAINQITKAGNRAAALVSQLLAFSRRQFIDPVDLDLNDTIRGLLAMLERVIGEHIRLEFHPAEGLATVHADVSMVEQILMNLCVNARDAMPDGGVLTIATETVTLDPGTCETQGPARPGRYVLLRVKDSGLGMDNATLQRIFEPFFSTKAPGHGTGLGLSTVYGIVSQHDGMVKATSEPGRGTAFAVYLPVSERPAQRRDAAVAEPVVAGNETVLVAEDDHAVRALTRVVLERSGYRVIEARDGEEAVTVFRQHAADLGLVILDVVMPKLGGQESFEQMRAIRADVPVLFSSGYSEDAVQADFAPGADMAIIKKPYAREALLKAVRDTIDRRKAP